MRECISILLFFGLTGSLLAQSAGGGEANPGLHTHQASLEKWQDMRFGMFIHWGPVSLRGTEIGWSRGPQVPIEEYDHLYEAFNPVLFNADEWVLAAKNAGMKYLVITTKHHDGFCLWPSDFTDYDIASTPYRKDILMQLAESCEKHGILFGTYYSICDWYHPDYTTRYGGDPRPVDSSNMDRYIDYMYDQLRELSENYETGIFWFDGYWEESWNHEEGMKLYRYCRELNPEALVNNRVDIGRKFKDQPFDPKYAGDFITPEQEIGSFNMDVPWESCITIGTQWSWKPNDPLKSTRELIHTLVRTSGGNGNLLLNVGPMMDGRIEKRQIQKLASMGQWLAEYGSSIYGTTGGPYKPTDWCASTRTGNTIFLHLLKWPEGTLRLKKIPGAQVANIETFHGKKLEYRTVGNEIHIALPEDPIDPYNTVLKIHCDGPVINIPPMDIPKHILRTPDGGRISLKHEPSPRYYGGGPMSLVDEEAGSHQYNDGRWLGFEEQDFEAVVDLEQIRDIQYIGIRFLQNQDAWIFFPTEVSFYLSENGETFTPAGETQMLVPKPDRNVKIRVMDLEPGNKAARYVRIVARNIGFCPPWHSGAGGKSWIFVDEIIIK